MAVLNSLSVHSTWGDYSSFYLYIYERCRKVLYGRVDFSLGSLFEYHFWASEQSAPSYLVVVLYVNVVSWLLSVIFNDCCVWSFPLISFFRPSTFWWLRLIDAAAFHNLTNLTKLLFKFDTDQLIWWVIWRNDRRVSKTTTTTTTMRTTTTPLTAEDDDEKTRTKYC